MTYITIGIPAMYVFGGERSAVVRYAVERSKMLAMFPSEQDRTTLRRVQRESLDSVGPLAMWVYCQGYSNGKACRQVTRAEFMAIAGPVLAGDA